MLFRILLQKRLSTPSAGTPCPIPNEIPTLARKNPSTIFLLALHMTAGVCYQGPAALGSRQAPPR
eukprot:1989610-Rhodomonas_salina.1